MNQALQDKIAERCLPDPKTWVFKRPTTNFYYFRLKLYHREDDPNGIHVVVNVLWRYVYVQCPNHWECFPLSDPKCFDKVKQRILKVYEETK